MAQWDLADSYTLTNGTWITGTVEDTWTENLTYLQIEEAGGAEGLVFSFTFLNIPDWVQWIDVDIIGRYEGNPAHVIKIRVWDFNLTQWDNITLAVNDFPSGDVDIKRDFQIEDPQGNDYIQNGEMRIQIYHPASGNPNHDFFVDTIYLEPFYIEDLLGKFDVGQGSAELLGKIFVRQDSAELLGKFDVGQDSVELLGKFEAQATAELLGKFESQATAELLGKFEAQATAELLGKFESQATAELLGRFEAQATADLLGKVDVTHSVDLLGKVDVTHSVDLLGKSVIRHEAIIELLGKCVIRHSDSKDLDANVEIVHWEDLYCKSIIRHTATLNLPAIFWTRMPRRLWTNRRYVNGVIELDEKLLGDASLEYVIEGVMEDTQGYLDNAGLPYSEWTNITLVPVQILRAVTYGTVAALYARHTQTFRSQVIPSVTPVTATVIGDAEKAMNYWEDRMNQMLEFYVTSQGGDIMLTSTLDEEPVFSMEDIPEEVTEYVSWRIWLQERGN